MYKACSKCGKVHDTRFKCKATSKISYYRQPTDKLRNTYAWAKKSEEIREDSNWLCSVCKEENIYTYDNLEVHHIIKLKDEPEKLLDNYNLICLCQAHHKAADKGDISVDYLLKLAKEREEK